MRVLLVDDDEDTRELFGIALQEAGAEVRAAASVMAALGTILQWPPSVVVSDLAMPTTDGLTLLREVRSMQEWLRKIPAIAVTGMTDPTLRAEALAAGFQEVVSKPLDLETLISTVRQWTREGSVEQ